jgi:hydrogenase-4 component F
MGLTLADIVAALPFGAAAVLACVASWRAGVRINAAAATVVFVATCLLPGRFHAAAPAHLALLTAFVAMTTSWLGWRDIPAALAARRLDRRSVRRHHVAFQALLGAILLALLSDSPAATWLGTAIAVAAAAGLIAAVRSEQAQRTADRLLLLCGVGLMLALFGTLLLDPAAQSDTASPRWRGSPLAAICLVLGYGGIAGLAPLHAWLPDAVAEGSTPGSVAIGALLANVPLLVMLRLRPAMVGGADAPAVLLIVLGLATLLVAAACLAARLDMRRRLAFAGTAQLGIVVFAFGLGSRDATVAGLVLMTMLALAKAAAFGCADAAPGRAALWTRTVSVLVLAGQPVVALLLLAGAAAGLAPWLLVPLTVGAMLTTGSLIGMLAPAGAGASAPVGGGGPAAVPGLVPRLVPGLLPVWLQLAAVVLLAVAMPGPMAGWFRAMAMFR